jgi:hypothetical protein
MVRILHTQFARSETGASGIIRFLGYLPDSIAQARARLESSTKTNPPHGVMDGRQAARDVTPRHSMDGDLV